MEANKALASSIQGKLHQQQSPSRGHHSIFRVPHVLLNDNERAYVPHLISIGPLHRGLRLETMEGIKLWYLRCLLQRNPTPNTGVEHFVEAIRGIEQDCRDSCEEQIDMSSDDFVEMLVVDGCFIVELFRKFSGLVLMEDEDPVLDKSWLSTTLINDLLLLENQLPWRVLNRLFDLTRETSAGNNNHPLSPSLPEITEQYFKEHSFGMHPRANGALESKHLLDFIRNSLLGSYAPQPQVEFELLSLSLIPSATKLAESGVLLVRGVKKDDMLNITFRNGVMRIPPIRVYKNGESLFRNLAAYEQCATATCASKFASYAVFLNHLIKSNKDVELLTGTKIIENFVGDDMAWLLNNLSNGVIV